MNKLRLIYAIFLLIIFVNLVSSSVVPVPIIIPVDNSPASGQGSGCLPPIDFAKEHNCEITFNNKITVNEFKCGEYILLGDCEGSYYHIENYVWWQDTTNIVALIFGILSVIILIFFMTLLRNIPGGLGI